MDEILERLNSQIVGEEEGPYYVLFAFIPIFHVRRNCSNIKKFIKNPNLLKKLNSKLIKFDIVQFKTLEDLFSSNIINSCARCLTPNQKHFKVFINDKIYSFTLKENDLKLIKFLFNNKYETVKELIDKNKDNSNPEIKRIIRGIKHKLSRLKKFGLKEDKKPRLSLLGRIIYFYNLYLEQNKNKKENIYI